VVDGEYYSGNRITEVSAVSGSRYRTPITEYGGRELAGELARRVRRRLGI
jgi:hypothetical protein